MTTALQLLAMYAKFPEACTVAVTLNTHTFSEDMNRKYHRVEPGIRLHPHLVDWDALVATSDSQLTYDGIHPTAQGQLLLAQAIRVEADDCVGP